MFKRHAPGQRLNKIPARAMNGLYEMLEERTRRGADILRGDSAEIMVKNNTGDVLQMFDLVGVGDVLHTPTENEHEFRGVNIFKGNTPSASSLIAVVQEPISDGGIGRAVVQGVTPCRLNVTASGDTHAGPTTSVTQLTTGTSGPAVILWKESGTGASKKAKVLLLGQQGTGGGGGGGGGGAAIETIVYQLSANDTYTTTNTYEELTGFNATTLGSLTYIEFPSTGYWLCEAHAFCYTEFSSIGLTAGAYDQWAEIWMRVKPVTGDSALIFVEDTATEIHGFLNAQLPNYLAPPAANNETDSCYGAGSISFLLRVDTAETKALEWHTINKIVGGLSPGNRSTTIYYTRNVGTGSTAKPTYLRATKVGEL